MATKNIRLLASVLGTYAEIAYDDVSLDSGNMTVNVPAGALPFTFNMMFKGQPFTANYVPNTHKVEVIPASKIAYTTTFKGDQGIAIVGLQSFQVVGG